MSDDETHFELLYPSEYIKAAELRGRDVSLTIKSVSVEELQLRGQNKTKSKPVVTFEERPKRFVMNRTNAEIIATAIGSKYTKDWVGRRITLYPTTTLFGKKTVECIRVRERLPEQSKGRSKAVDSEPELGNQE